MSTVSEKAVECFSSGFNCSQSVISSHCEKYGLDKETAFKLACGFGAGMGYGSQVCGAVSGAIMLIGLKYGKYRQEDTESKDVTYRKVKQFITDFIEKNGSVNCSALVGYEISHEEELLKARESGVFKRVCPSLVRDAVEIVERYL